MAKPVWSERDLELIKAKAGLTPAQLRARANMRIDSTTMSKAQNRLTNRVTLG